MYARLQKIALWLLAILVFYLLFVRVFITAIQFFPQQTFSFIGHLTGSSISFQQLQIDQSWIGFDFEVEGFQLKTDSLVFNTGRLHSDINLFSPFIPREALGGQLESEDTYIEYQSTTQGEFSSLDQERSAPFLSLEKVWEVVRLENVALTIYADEVYHLKIDHFNSYSGIKWSFGGEIQLAINDQPYAKGQVLGDLNLEQGGGAGYTGDLKVSIQDPVSFSQVRYWLPNAVNEVMPTGELAGDISVMLKQSELKGLKVNLIAQGLEWKENNDSKPKSVGLTLDWLTVREEMNHPEGGWVFKLSEARFDSRYLSTASPIYVTFNQKEELKVVAEKFDFQLFRPFVETYIHFQNEAFGDVEHFILQGSDLNFVWDLETLDVKVLEANVQTLSIAQSNEMPSVQASNFRLSKHLDALKFSSSNPIKIQYDKYRQQAILIQLDSSFVFSLDQDHWELDEQKVVVDGVPVRLVGKGNFLGEIDLNVFAEWQKLSILKGQLPYFLMPKKVESFLKEGLIAGDAVSAHLQLHGNLKEEGFWQTEGNYLAKANIKNAGLMFDQKWPTLEQFDATLTFKPFQLLIETGQAKLHNQQLQNVRVEINDLDNSSVALKAYGESKGTSLNIKPFLLATPLAEQIGIQAFLEKDINVLEGEVIAELSELYIPLDSSSKASLKVRGHVKVEKTNLNLWNKLHFTEVEGILYFTDKGLSSDQLTARFQNGEAVVKIETDTKTLTTTLTAKGVAKYDNEFADGSVPWTSLITFNKALGVEVVSELDFTQAQSRMPAPFSEKALQGYKPEKLNSRVTLKEDLLSVDVKLNQLAQIKGNINLAEANSDSWSFKFKKGLSFDVEQPAKGIQIQLELDTINIDQWRPLIPIIEETWFSEEQDAKGLRWLPSRIKVNGAKLFDYTYHNVLMEWTSLQESNEQLALKLMSDDFAMFADQKQGDQVVLRVDKLNIQIPENEADENDPTVKSEKALCKNPKISHLLMPDIQFVGRNIQVNETKVESLQFRIKDTPTQLSFSGLEGSYGKKGSFVGEYQYHKIDNKSQLELKLKSNRVEDIVELLQIKKGIEGKKGNVELDLAWKGKHECFSVLHAKGRLKFKIEEGEIKNAEPGVAKLIGLLSVESLARRIKLDLGDVTSSGLVFDQLEGKGRFRKGIFGLEELKLKAPSANAWMFGEINLVEEQLNLTAEITPAIGSTLPAIAAISGVATPLAGLAAYALLKAVPIINEDLVTYRYEVKGDIKNPKIKDKGLALDLFNVQTPKENNILDSE